jgi:uncharacterized protein (DUF488 family)
MAESLPVFTIGHSTRTIPEFATLLQAGGVRCVVDIRHFARSRTNPQYNQDRLPDELAPYQIGHLWIEALGGRRKKSDLPPALNGFWTNASFHNYADYALSPAFQAGLDRLLAVSAQQRTAIMCAEALWWRCHRRIVADYLIHAGRTVYHLMGKDNVVPATLTEAAVPAGPSLHYPG